MPSYPLTVRPWIPVADLTTQDYREVGLTEALTRAHELRLTARPGQEHAVLLRVLLASYDAAAGPASWTQWTQAWQATALDTSRITAYLERWADRLDLYHPQRPAFQAGGLTQYPRAHTTLHPAYLGGDAAAWFNPALANAAPIEAAQAARYLLVRSGYDVAGIKGGVGGGRTYGSWLGPLGPVTHLSLTARTLKDELLLNLPPAPRRPGDMPVWERPEDLPLTPGARTPVPGRLAWWTWPARLLRLEPDSDGRVVALAWHDGLRPDTSTWEAAQAHDPMTAWTGPDHRLTPAVESDPYLPAWFPGRAVLGGTAVVDHAVRAAEAAILPADLPLRLTASWTSYNIHKSVMTDEASGTAHLGPAGLLADPGARRQMAAAAHVAQSIPQAIRRVLARTLDSGKHSYRASGLLLNGMDRPWEQLLRDLADARGDTDRGWHAVRAWRDTVQAEALDLFDRQVRTNPPTDKIKARVNLVGYLDHIPLDALPTDQEAADEPAAAGAA